MNAVSVKSIEALLSSTSKIRSLLDRFGMSFSNVKADVLQVYMESQATYESICRQYEDAGNEVERCKDEVERIKDEIDYLRDCRDDYEDDDFHYELDSLRDDLQDARSELNDARKDMERLEQKRDRAQVLYNDIRRLGENIQFMSDSIINNSFENCRSFIERYGSYLRDVKNSM